MLYNSSAVRPVSQTILDLPSQDSEKTFYRCLAVALKWVAGDGRARGQRIELPREAYRGEPFQLELDAHPVQADTLDGYWVVKVDEADTSVPQRTWITEMGISRDSDALVKFGCRLYCRSLGEDPPYEPSVPKVVPSVAHLMRATVDGEPVSQRARSIDDEGGVEELVRLLCEATRQLSVIIVTAPPNEGTPAISPDSLARSLIGVAHVAFLTEEASHQLTSRLGKRYSVFGGGIRTYRTGFHPEADEPRAHPLKLFDSIVNSPDGAGAFHKFLVSRTMALHLKSRHLLGELPDLKAVKEKVAEKDQEERRQKLEELRKQSASASDLETLAFEDNERLRQQIKDLKTESERLLYEAELEREAAIRDRDDALGRAYSLRRRIESLEGKLKDRGGDVDTAIPTTLDEVDSWCEENLSGHVLLLPRAFRGLKKSRLEDTELIYKALILLRDHYVPARKEGIEEHWKAFEKSCDDLGLEESPSITNTRAGEERDDYYVDYYGNSVLLDRHLKKGNDREPRYCFRLYFFWDEEQEQAVVGSLPSHLKTRLS